MGCGAVERQGAGKGIKQKNEENKPNQTISDKLCRYMKHIEPGFEPNTYLTGVQLFDPCANGFIPFMFLLGKSLEKLSLKALL